jgi:hypothetical protein
MRSFFYMIVSHRREGRLDRTDKPYEAAPEVTTHLDIKLFLMVEWLLLVGKLMGQSSHGQRSYMSLKFRPYVAVSNEMKQTITAEVDGVKIFKNIQFLPLFILNYM